MANNQTTTATDAAASSTGACRKFLDGLYLFLTTTLFRPLRHFSSQAHPPPPPADRKKLHLILSPVEIEPATPPPPPTSPSNAEPKPSPSPAPAPAKITAQHSKYGPGTNGPAGTSSPSVMGPQIESKLHGNVDESGKERWGLTKAKSDINERVDEYIKRTKIKFRTPTRIVSKTSSTP